MVNNMLKQIKMIERIIWPDKEETMVVRKKSEETVKVVQREISTAMMHNSAIKEEPADTT